MVVLVDLDGTLVDRAAAFTQWARAFVAGAGGSDRDTRWLLDLVDDVVVSEAVGAEEPDATVFQMALERARRAGGSGRAWMVGDHPDADVGGGRASGLLTGWVSHGRTWPGGPPPDLSAPATAQLLAAVKRTSRSA